MKRIKINGYDLAYLDLGTGPPLLCVHGSLGDFRCWSPVLGLLSRGHRLLVPSLRHYFPEHWDGIGGGFTIAQHKSDLIAFIESLGAGAVDLLGHSRGGHLAFRIAEERPDLVRRLVLAEPGGDLDASLMETRGGDGPAPASRSRVAAAAQCIAGGDIEAGMTSFFDGIEGEGAWQRRSESARQQMRDNARTLLGQVNEGRRAYARAQAESLRVPALLIGGAETRGSLARNLRALSAVLPRAHVALLANATHMMYEDDPVGFSRAVLEFIDAPEL